jgi:hypothetical protein
VNKLTDDQQKKAAELLAHEIGMLVVLPQYLQDRADECRYWACLEAFLVHVRILDDFFFRKPTEDDICVRNFVPPQWSPPEDSKELPKQVRLRINKMLTHFTVGRIEYVTDENTNWDVPGLRKNLLASIKHFLSEAVAPLPDVINKRLQEKFGLSIKQIAELCKTDDGNTHRAIGTGTSSTQAGPGRTPEQPPAAPYCQPPGSSGGTTTSGTYVKPKPPGQDGS